MPAEIVRQVQERDNMASAILTKYIGPTDTKGSRIKAWSVSGRSVTIGYPYELSGEAIYRKALQAWCEAHRVGCRALGIAEDGCDHKNYVGGETKEGYAFVRKV